MSFPCTVLMGMWLLPCTPLLAASSTPGFSPFSVPIPMPGAHCPHLLSPLMLREVPVAPTCPGTLWQPLAVPPALHPPALRDSAALCQAGCSKWSVRSSNRAWFCSGAPCLSLELSFCSHCPWLFPSPSAFAFPPAREGEKSSTRPGMTKWMLLCSSSSAFLQHQDADAKGKGGAGHILGFNDVF